MNGKDWKSKNKLAFILNGFIRDASMTHGCGSAIMWIIPKSSIAKNLMVKHGVAVNKRGRTNTWSLKVSEFSQ